MHGDHRTMANASASMDRGQDLFRAREARERAAEAQLLEEYAREQAEKQARERAAAQAEALAKELERRQREHDAKQRMQQKARARARVGNGRCTRDARTQSLLPFRVSSGLSAHSAPPTRPPASPAASLSCARTHAGA
jgi:hypothetical protein